MIKKTYLSPSTYTVYIPVSTPLMAGSVITPGSDNEEPGARELFDDSGTGIGVEEDFWQL